MIFLIFCFISFSFSLHSVFQDRSEPGMDIHPCHAHNLNVQPATCNLNVRPQRATLTCNLPNRHAHDPNVQPAKPSLDGCKHRSWIQSKGRHNQVMSACPCRNLRYIFRQCTQAYMESFPPAWIQKEAGTAKLRE